VNFSPGYEKLKQLLKRISEKNKSQESKIVKWLGFCPVLALLQFVILAQKAVFYKYPIGYAGLYTLMFERLAENHFILPETIPYYNIKLIPFAYPPLTFYIAAFVTKILHVSSLDYLRFLPVFLGVACTIAFYFLTYSVKKEHQFSTLSTVLFILMPVVYSYHFTAAGMVRGFALLFSLLFSLFLWKSFFEEDSNTRNALLSGVFFLLTILSHMTYALVCAAILVVFLGFSKHTWQRKSKTFLILAGVTVIGVLPWLWHILKHWGFSILLNPLNSHSNIQIESAFLYYFKRLVNLTDPWIMGLFLLSLFHSLFKKQYMLIVLMVIILVGIGESDRFLVIIFCFLSAEFLLFWLDSLDENSDKKTCKKITNLKFLLILFLLFFLSYQNYNSIVLQKPVLSDSFIETGLWLRNNVDTEDSILFLEGHSLSEWLPYFSHRIPETGHWGSEWLGTYGEESTQQFLIQASAASNSLSLFNDVVQKYSLDPDYVVIDMTNEIYQSFIQQYPLIIHQSENYIVIQIKNNPWEE